MWLIDHHRTLAAVSLAIFCTLLFVPFLGDRDLISSHEARAAQNAQMILDDGDWLLPRLYDRHVELQKPPLYYWVVALLGWLNGGVVNAWAVRLPAALSALACVLFLYYVGVRSNRPRAGFLAAAVLASCLHFTWLARVGRIDMPLTFTITLALGAFHLCNTAGSDWKNKTLWQGVGYAALGIGLLLKGPIALVLPAIVCGAVWLLRDRRLHLRTSLWWGVPLVLLIAAPWYVAANLRTEGRLWEVFFWYHNVERGLGGSETLKAYPFWFYVPQLFLDMLPWSLVMPAALYVFLRNRAFRADADACLGLTWCVSIVAFLSCMSFKRADYLLPAYPGMAIFLGVTLDRWWQRRAEERNLTLGLHSRAAAIVNSQSRKTLENEPRSDLSCGAAIVNSQGRKTLENEPSRDLSCGAAEVECCESPCRRSAALRSRIWRSRVLRPWLWTIAAPRLLNAMASPFEMAQFQKPQATVVTPPFACASGSKAATAALGFILTAYAVGWLVYDCCFLPPEEKAWPYRAMAQEIRRQTPGPVIFFRAESHVLMYHLGKPVDTILEWENLAWWVNRPRPVYFVMPEACADEWREYLSTGSLEEVLRTSDHVHGKRDRPLVVLRNRGQAHANP